MSRTIEQIAQETLDIQNACNLSGVVHGFSRVISNLREIYPNEGTKFFNEHPICVLWADKIASLTHCSSIFSDAYKEVCSLSKKY